MSDLHFSKAPIIEAIINIGLVTPVSIEALSTVAPLVANDYSQKSALFAFKTEIKGGELPDFSTHQDKIGWQFRNNDDRQVFQARTNGFSFHRLAPYDRWEPFRSEARRLWQIYSAALSYPKAGFYTVRYINRLELPVDRELGDFVNVFPELRRGLPQRLSSYLMRLEMPLEEDGSSLVLQQNLTPSDSREQIALVLDNEFRFPVSGQNGDDDHLWDLIESARDKKNRIFLDCLTTEMKEKIR